MILDGYVKLNDNFIPKNLEKPYLLDKKNDDLYELTQDAFDFVLKCDGSYLLSQLKPPKKFLQTLLKNSIIEITERLSKRDFIIASPPKPTLRYLEVQLTDKCNLKCLHCYQGEKNNSELDFSLLKKVLKDFIKIQGLRIIISGGEPLLYKRFSDLNKLLKDYPARVVLLTNGTLITKHKISEWNFDEVQISLDGMEQGHDFLRGHGCFKSLCTALEKIKKESSMDISFATMIHKKNVQEFKQMKRFVKSFSPKEWGIDYPVVVGNLKHHNEIVPAIEDSVKFFKYRFGASFHSTGQDELYGCGTHLMTLTAKGNFVPCGFYTDRIFGNVKEGLVKALTRRTFVNLNDIEECKQCKYLFDCRGGCRFRAGSSSKRDEIMCKVFGA